VDAILDGCLLEEPYQKILDGLQEALDAHRPLDGQLIRDLDSHAGTEGQLLQLAEEQAVPSYAPYYAEKLRQARLYQSIRAKANQLYNHPESIGELLPELTQLAQQVASEGGEPLALALGHTREREVAHTIVPNLLYAERITVQPAKVLWLDFDHSWGRLQEILEREQSCSWCVSESRARAAVCCCCTTCGNTLSIRAAPSPCRERTGGLGKPTPLPISILRIVRDRIGCASPSLKTEMARSG
jgi:hypothetical protein